MGFDWKLYHKLAEHMTTSCSTELEDAAYRSRISRSYYAAFCTAREFVIEKITHRQFEKKGNVHRKVPELLKQQNNINLVKVSDALGELRDLRNAADYDNEYDAKSKIEQVDELIQQIFENLDNQKDFNPIEQKDS